MCVCVCERARASVSVSMFVRACVRACALVCFRSCLRSSLFVDFSFVNVHFQLTVPNIFLFLPPVRYVKRCVFGLCDLMAGTFSMRSSTALSMKH